MKNLYKISLAVVVAMVFALAGVIVTIGTISPREVNAGDGIINPIPFGNDGDGDGSIATPLLIGSFATLNAPATRTLLGQANRHFQLINDINMTGNQWVRVPTFGLNSVFEGNGHNLIGFTQVNIGLGAGMFNTFLGTMQNVNFTNVNVTGVTGTQGAGLIASTLTGSIGTNTAGLINVHVLSGNFVGNATATGGLFGYLLPGLTGTSAAARANFIIENSSVRMNQVTGGNSTGGLVGRTSATNMNVTIRNSFFNGGSVVASGNLVGGILGYDHNGTNRTLIIEDIFVLASGQLHATTGHAGGISGGTAGGNIKQIRNSFVIGVVPGAVSTSGAVVGHGTAMLVHNTHFATDGLSSTHNRISGGGLSAVNITGGSGGRTAASMRTQAFVDILNAGREPAVWMMGENGHPIQRVFEQAIEITFDANGGNFAGEPTYEYQIANPGTPMTNVPTPTRIGFTFRGWNLTPDGVQGTDILLADIPTHYIITVYATWTAIVYEFRTENAPNQTINPITLRHDGGAEVIPQQFTINQGGFLSVALNASGTYHFVSWQAQNSAGEWINIGTGDEWATGIMGRRLDIVTVEDGENIYLVNENFITNFVRLDGSTPYVLFRALYTNFAPVSVTIDTVSSAQRIFGTLSVDSFDRNFGTIPMSFPSGEVTLGVDIIISPINEFRNIALVERSLNGGAYTPYTASGTFNAAGEWEYSIDLSGAPAGFEISFRVTFGIERFDISVVSNFNTEMIGNGVHAAAIAGSPNLTQVGLGDEFYGIQLNSVEGFRLNHTNLNNFQIYNRRTNRWDNFHANGGAIVFDEYTIDEDFLLNYLHNGEIVLVAVFVRQFTLGTIESMVSGTFEQDMIEEIRIQITELNGFRHRPTTLGAFDEGVTVRLDIFTRDDVVIDHISMLGATELSNQNGTIILLLTSAATVNIHLELRQFTFVSPVAIDMDNNSVGGVTFVTELNGLAIVGNDLAEDDELVITPTFDATSLTFLGWFVQVGENFYALPFDLTTNILTFTFGAYAMEHQVYEFELRFVARFTGVHAVNFIINGTGSITTHIYDDGEWIDATTHAVNATVNFPEGARIRITAEAGAHFQFNGFDGQMGSEIPVGHVLEIFATGIRHITTNFVPQLVTIEITSDLNSARGSFDYSTNRISIGDVIVLSFNVQSGFQRSTWTINGLTFDQLRATYSNVVESGDTWLFTFNAAWYARQGGSDIHSVVTTTMSMAFMIGMLVAAVVIPLLVLFLVMMLLSNAKKRRQYAELQRKRSQGNVMMGQTEALKKLREDAQK